MSLSFTARVQLLILVTCSSLVWAGEAPVFFAGSEDAKPRCKLDDAVFNHLKKLNIQPAKSCTDSVFVRRVYLDVIGTLPTAEEVRSFLSDPSPDKRATLIDNLLAREEYADYWAMKWCDLLRVKAEFPINLWPNAAQAYHRWIRTAIHENRPYDRFARELLTSSGSNFRVPQVNFYRAMQNTQLRSIAQTVALTFMGVRADKWKKEKLEGFGAFFTYVGYKRTAEWKEEIVFYDAIKAAEDASAGKTVAGVLPDGTRVALFPERDPREIVADWLISKKNPYFNRCVVNRIWFWLYGHGIVHEPDDLRDDNPPRNPELMALLEKELVESKYDLKHMYRLILNSQTYQLSCIPQTKHAQSEEYFAAYPIRRLDAEVLVDALCRITGTTEEYSSLIPEPFTFIPPTLRSIQLPDGSITSSFLEMFGRPPRDTGMLSERNNNTTAAQRLHLLNSSHVQKKIERSQKLRKLLYANRKEPRKGIEALYLTILSRYPTKEELRAAKGYFDYNKKQKKGQNPIVDLTWALVNSAEFLYRH